MARDMTIEARRERVRAKVRPVQIRQDVFAAADPAAISASWPAWCGGDAPAIGPDGWRIDPPDAEREPEIVQRAAMTPQTAPWAVRIEGIAPAGPLVIACWSIDEANVLIVERADDGAVTITTVRDGIEAMGETGLVIVAGAPFRLGLAVAAQRIATALNGVAGAAVRALRPIGLTMESLGQRWDATGAGGVTIAEVRYQRGLATAKGLEEWTKWS